MYTTVIRIFKKKTITTKHYYVSPKHIFIYTYTYGYLFVISNISQIACNKILQYNPIYSTQMLFLKERYHTKHQLIQCLMSKRTLSE